MPLTWEISRLRRGQSSVASDLRPRYYGLYSGRVVYNKDPEQLGRIQVRVAEAHGLASENNKDENLPWALVNTFFGGFYDGGSHTPFPKGSEVWVQFEHGDSDRPVVMGGVSKRPSSDWEYGQSGESMGPWYPQDQQTDIPKDVRGDREQTRYALFKTPKGVTLVVEERDGEEAVYLIDRAGQVIEFVSPVTSAANQGNQAQRGARSVLTGDQLSYSEILGAQASIRLIDLAQQHILLRALDGGEAIEILNQKRGGLDVQRVILDNTQGSEEIRIEDRKEQKIVMRCGSEKNILIQSGNARIRVDGDQDTIWLDAGDIHLNQPGPAGE